MEAFKNFAKDDLKLYSPFSTWTMTVAWATSANAHVKFPESLRLAFAMYSRLIAPPVCRSVLTL